MRSRVLLSASLFHAVNDAAAVAVPMVFPLLYNRGVLITRYADIGVLANLGLLVTMVFQIFIVQFAQRIEYRHFLLISILGITAALVLVTLAGSFAWLLAPYLAMRIFLSFYHPMGTAMVSRTHPDAGLDFAMGVQSGSGNLGVFLAFISVGFLSQNLGWRWPLWIWAAVCLGVGWLCHHLVRETRTRHAEHPRPDLALWRATRRRIRACIPGFIFGGACWGVTVYYAPSLLNHRFQVEMGTTGIFMAVWIGLGTLMPYLFGTLAKRFGRERIALAGVTGAACFAALLSVSPTTAWAVPALFLFGACLFLVFPALQSTVGRITPPEDQAIAFSLAANLQMLSGAVVNLLAGFLSDALGIQAPFLFLAAAGVITTIYLAGGKGRLSPDTPLPA